MCPRLLLQSSLSQDVFSIGNELTVTADVTEHFFEARR
jgi:hypothetical protein